MLQPAMGVVHTVFGPHGLWHRIWCNSADYFLKAAEKARRPGDLSGSGGREAWHQCAHAAGIDVLCVPIENAREESYQQMTAAIKLKSDEVKGG